MFISSSDLLDDLSDDELWEVAADTRNDPDTRHAAISRWLYPDGGNLEDDGNDRFMELQDRATIIEKDELEEDDIEELERTAPYFDGEGRLLIEHDGVQYLIDNFDDPDYADDFSDDEF
jgi:hypothetical protein